MTPFNATVESGFTGRDGKIRLWVIPDGRGREPRMIEYPVALPEGKRVRLDGAAIVEVQ